jgi:hypothetical protein
MNDSLREEILETIVGTSRGTYVPLDISSIFQRFY